MSLCKTNRLNQFGQVITGAKEPPQVLEPLKSINITEGDSVILSTQIVAIPTAKIVWYKDGKPLVFDGKNVAEKVSFRLYFYAISIKIF
jgi:hypothetical protein